MDKISYPDISRSVLANLLDLAGESMGISPRPLMGKPRKLNKKQISELSEWDIIGLSKMGDIRLSHPFARIAGVLLDPRTNINFRIWGSQNMCAETSILFPGYIMEGSGVILNQIGSYYRIRAFVDDSTIFDLLRPILPSGKEENVDFEFEGHFDVSDAAVLFGAIDLARRQRRMEKRSNGRNDPLTFSSDQLSNYISDEWGLTGFDQFITYIAVSGMKPVPPTMSEMTRSLQSLERAKALIKVDTKHYSISPVLEPLVNLATGLQSGLQWQRVSLDPLGELEATNRIYLFGDQSLILCLSPTTEGRIFISKIKQSELLDFLIQEITTFPHPAQIDSIPPIISSSKPQESETPPAEALMRTPSLSLEMICSNCGAVLDSEENFCSRCGTRVEKSVTKKTLAQFCTNCGQPLKAQTRFCTSCGKPVGLAVSSIPPPVRDGIENCSKCGAKVRQGKKFCTECGSPVA